MKKLIRRLSRVADSSQYTLLHSKGSPRRPKGGRRSQGEVPEGHIPVYVGLGAEASQSQRFLVSAEMLNHPVLVGLLDWSAQEYGYHREGALRIPCHALLFERLLRSLALGDDVVSPDHYLHHFISALSLHDSP